MKSLVLTLKAEEVNRHRDVFYRQLILLFGFISLMFIGSRSYGQCEMKFEYEVENCSPGKSDGKIYVKLVEGSGSFTFELYELPKANIKVEKIVETLKINDKILLFNNISPSLYIIQVSNGIKGCEPITINKGTRGIKVGTKEF